jgi:hypothetical protein
MDRRSIVRICCWWWLTPVTQRVQNIRSLIARLDWRFSAWADEFTELYFKALSCPYAEVRALVSTILNSLDQLRVCYPHESV